MDGPFVVFILATNYAGSHLLAQLLAAHSRCAGVGELHNYRKFRERGSRSGNVVDDYQDHPAFAALDALPVTAWHRAVFERLRSGRAELTHLIDNSKRTDWARQFPEVNTYLLHLIRDPRALVARWERTYASDRARRGQRRRVLRRKPWALAATRDSVGVYVEKWLLANRAISRFVAGRRGRVVAYRDLCVETRATLQRVMPFLGLDFEEAQLDYGAAGAALGTRKRDYQDVAARSAIDIDLRWQHELAGGARRRIEHHRGVNAYLREIGLDMVSDGLTAAGEDEKSPGHRARAFS